MNPRIHILGLYAYLLRRLVTRTQVGRSDLVEVARTVEEVAGAMEVAVEVGRPHGGKEDEEIKEDGGVFWSESVFRIWKPTSMLG